MRNDKGVTLIELILVVAITAIIGVASYPVGAGFLNRNYHKNSTNELVSSLRTAQLNTISGMDDSQWGVRIASGEIIMFKGSFYSEPGTEFDQTFSIPQSVSFSPATEEIVFSKLTGNPDAAKTVVITSSNGDIYTVTINEVGTVNVN